MYKNNKNGFAVILLSIIVSSSLFFTQALAQETEIDLKVKKFLDSWNNKWRDMNVPEVDGQILYDTIIENNYTKALEIGTSTGRSGIWIAWALSKTGGKLITIDIDERRYNQAVKNFEEAGLSEFIDARLADAHKMVPALEGPFDLVFIDADKDWYTNYAKAVIPKLEAGGCIAAHNISERSGRSRSRRSRSSYSGSYLEYMRSLPDMETSLVNKRRSSLCLSYNKKDK